jgi:hypothetical protein
MITGGNSSRLASAIVGFWITSVEVFVDTVGSGDAMGDAGRGVSSATTSGLDSGMASADDDGSGEGETSGTAGVDSGMPSADDEGSGEGDASGTSGVAAGISIDGVG